MPFDFNDPNQRFFPGDPWTRDGSQDPEFENAPFGLAPAFPSSSQRSAAYPGADGDPVLRAAFMGWPGSQSNNGMPPSSPIIPDQDAPFGFAPYSPAPNKPVRSINSPNGFEDFPPIVQAGFPRGRGITLPGPGPVPPAPSGPFDWQTQTEQAIMRLWNFLQRRGTVGATGSGWDEDCKEKIREARQICTDAYADGWKKNQRVGPYSKPEGGPWTIQDCMRGLIPERCGGNAVDKD